MSREIEEWKAIEGYEGLYEVSDWGRVRSLDTTHIGKNQHGATFLNRKKGKVLKLGKDGVGRYSIITLHKNGVPSTKLVHRLVAEAFIPNEEGKPCVGHKDCDPSNNNIDNLYWCTYIENNNHPITRKRMSEGQRRYFENGGVVAFKGRKHTEEAKEKNRLSHLGMFEGEKNPMYGKRVEKSLRPVVQYTMDDEFVNRFECTKDAANSVGCAPTNITACCRGKLMTVKGFKWKYDLT